MLDLSWVMICSMMLDLCCDDAYLRCDDASYRRMDHRRFTRIVSCFLAPLLTSYFLSAILVALPKSAEFRLQLI